MKNDVMSFEEYNRKTYKDFLTYMQAWPEEDMKAWYESVETQAMIANFYKEDVEDHENGVKNAFNDGAAYALSLIY